MCIAARDGGDDFSIFHFGPSFYTLVPALKHFGPCILHFGPCILHFGYDEVGAL
ncbi:hypothetical protein HanHA300_Chr07g0240541 [Helianthus annuus]|nr:hypothetical protein HanHA300_Chr07g0240541 [Helianthus annuus]KAJ0562965.1 hypothetical protein HanHA89_Chr07g0257751 [Helianthus annuus]KAJ0728332.1 hypothetical protein HanLR1_Chr07g0240421 [Helianthus annuus]KAJ0731098.1 hypothetical protein HanOQP8_Chr07g0248071 [Helianthus annuus]